MPCPSAQTKYFLSKTILKLSRTKFCPGLKSPFFSFKSHWMWMYLIKDKFSRHFQSGNFILIDFWNLKMDFLTLDKIFVLDNLKIVLDKKCFVRADGRGNNYWKIFKNGVWVFSMQSGVKSQVVSLRQFYL